MKRKLDIGIVSSSSFQYENASIKNIPDHINPWTHQPFSQQYYDILTKRKQLPVYEFKDELEAKVRANQVIIVEGETGSGKTTQIPQVNYFVPYIVSVVF